MSNTKLRLTTRKPAWFWPFGASKPTVVTRYWPRNDRQEASDHDAAVEMLIGHVRGLARYLAANGHKAAMGLTAGKDSRLLFAALHDADPYLFTFVRSRSGLKTSDEETRAARLVAERYGATREVYAIRTQTTEEDVSDPFAYAYRRSSSYLRGRTAIWQKRLAEKGFDYASTRFIRGSGGEVLRGFYQKTRRSIRYVNALNRARAYSINVTSPTTLKQFCRFMRVADFSTRGLRGWDANDTFYWEHRMGLWGSASLSEADLALPALAGYNSRNLFVRFMRLPWPERKDGRSFQKATMPLAPKLADLPD